MKLTIKFMQNESIFWILMNQGFLKILLAFKFFILAKLLGVSLIGQFSIVLLIIAFSEAITEFGFNFSFVSKIKDQSKKQINSLWTVSIFRGTIASIIILIFSSIVLKIIDKEILMSSVYIASFIPLIRSINNIYNLLYLRERNFKQLFKWNFIYIMTDVCLSILVAIKYPSVTNIIITYVFAEVVKVIFSYILFKGKPKLDINFYHIKEELNYGKWAWKSSVLTYFINQLDKFLVPVMLGTTIFGGYQSIYKVAQFGLTDFSQLLSSVLFPRFSYLNRNERSSYNILNKTILLVSICLILFAVSFVYFRKEIILLSVGKEFVKFSNLYIIFLSQMILGVYTAIFVSYLRAINKPEVITFTTYLQFWIVCIGLSFSFFLELSYYFIASVSLISLLIANLYFVKIIYSDLKNQK